MSSAGIELEGDDKHVHGVIEEWRMQECSAVSTPYVKPPASMLTTEGRKPLAPKDATLFRRAAARINYVALDRPDLSFASRVAAGKMSNPLEGDDMLIKRVIRYLKGRPRVAIVYQFQEAEPDVVVMTDSDWAGDELTRRNTSGGVVLNGTHTHTITWWCKSKHASHCCCARPSSTRLSKGLLKGSMPRG